MLGLVAVLLFFTPSPFADLGMYCHGELDTDWCASATGMEGWVVGLVFVPIGDCCFSCVGGDGCGVLLDCVCVGVLVGLGDHVVAGCGGTTNCGDVMCVEMVYC